MSILKKPYEIAVYDDVFVNGVFQEKRLGIIGSDKMTSQNRALQPNLVRNVNGQNTFSFQMYKTYIDVVTGEKVSNPFSNWLINERKVKLRYDGKWYDFIIKDVNENTSNYLYTYQLEDANIQELSKNGFGITLDAELMNNIGDSVSLGRQVMAETDWQVDGDVIIERVDEALVYVTIPKNTTVKHIIDQAQDANGNYSIGLTEEDFEFKHNTTVLAFYSSCTNKPHRFQFIYCTDFNKDKDGSFVVNRKDDRTIDEKNCQYYIDFNKPDTAYKVDNERTSLEKSCGIFLPKNWTLASPSITSGKESQPEYSDSQISTWYRGKRYGFAQQSVYVPLLERYCEKYKKDDVDYLGYIDTHYVSPTVIQNYISGYNFESISGWTATSTTATSSADRPVVENFYGRYDVNNGFISITDDFLNGSYNENNTYTPYMKMTFFRGGGSQFVLNSSIKSNRTIIGNLPVGHELVLDYTIRNANNEIVSDFTFELAEYIYNITTGGYNEGTNRISFTQTKDSSRNRIYFTVQTNDYTEKEFKKDSKVFLKLVPPNFNSNSEEAKQGINYYIESISLYEKALDKNGNIIIPDYEEEESEAVSTWADMNNLQKDYKLFPAWSIDSDNPNKIVDKESLVYDTITTLDYNIYKPVYNAGGVKIRSVSVKESNYFNVLQTIAETFEQWLVINVERDEYGAILPYGKKISFKNYRGDNNYACFRYGVNLKDIQRTNTSKNIVTKLVVKQNANELAKDGFCTIQRAGSNPTGENYIYDFQYYHNTGIMDTEEYLNTNYYLENPIGWDRQDSLVNVCSAASYRMSRDSNLQYVSEFCKIIKDGKINGQDIDDGKKYIFMGSFKWSLPKYSTLQPLNNNRESQIGLRLQLCEASWVTADNVIELPTKQGGTSFLFAVDGKLLNQIIDGKHNHNVRFVEYRKNSDGIWGTERIYSDGSRIWPENAFYNGNTSGIELSNIEFGFIGTDNSTTENYFAIEEDKENISGYFIRLKELNNKIAPLDQQIIGVTADLVKEKAQLEIAETTIEAAMSGMESTREDFRMLTGLYPEEIQVDDIESIQVADSSESGYDGGWFESSATITNKNQLNVFIDVKNRESNIQHTPVAYLSKIEKYGNLYNIIKTKEEKNGGIELQADYVQGGHYRITYDLEIKTGGIVKNIGFYEDPWMDTNLSVGKQSSDKTQIHFETALSEGVYQVTFTGTYQYNAGDAQFYCFYIIPNMGIELTTESDEQEICTVKDIKLTLTNDLGLSAEPRTAHANIDLQITTTSGSDIVRTLSVPCEVPAGAKTASVSQVITPIDNTRDDVQKYIAEYTTYEQQLDGATEKQQSKEAIVEKKEQQINILEAARKRLLEQKTRLNQLFFKRYARFIQEGTWISEEYVDDDKYYADAQSVLYNSCYPQVSYNINVLELSQLPGYELFKFNLGDKTYAIDDEFFGTGVREEVIITELSEKLDDPSGNTIKVQNFKNQFQDLFQRITATVQQAQYNAGSYEKGEALVDANEAKKNEFVTKALTEAATSISLGGNHTVTWEDGTGITVQEDATPENKVRIVGSGILLSAKDPKTQKTTWVTGLTNKGISANLITAGKLNTGEIQIMTGNDATFKWDVYGLSAYDSLWYNDASTGIQTISGVDTKKFVRFDKNGIYGINNIASIDGKTWHPTGTTQKEIQKEIDDNATFALTWEGLKVTQGNATARIGNYTDENDNKSIIKINNGTVDTFVVDENGNVTIRGDLKLGDGTTFDTPNPNLLPYSNFVHPKDWNPVCLANEDGTNLRYAQITQAKLFNNNQTLHVYSLNGDATTAQWCGGTKWLDKDDRDFSKGEELTVSFWYFIPSTYIFDEEKSVDISKFGFSFKAVRDEETDLSDQHYFEIPFKNCVKDKWIKVVKTFKFSSNCKSGRIYAFVRNYGEAYFAEFKVERGNRATTWIPNKYDEFNTGINLYRGSSSIKIPASDSKYSYNYFDITTNKFNSATPVVQDNSLLTEGIIQNQAYYFSADVDVTWDDTITDKDRHISVAFYAIVPKGGGYTWSGSTITHLPINNGKISGVLRTPHLIVPGNKYSDRVNMDHLIIYAGHAGNCNPGGATFSNIRITKGTVPENFESNVSSNFSWKFDKQEGITMWNGEQGSGAVTGQNKDDNVVFKIYNTTEGHKLFVKGEVVAEAGSIAGWQLNSVTFQEKEIPVFQSRSSQINGSYYATGLGISNNINDPVFWAGMRTGGGQYNPWAVGNVPGWSLEKVLKERTPFYVTGTGEMYAQAGNIAGWEIDKLGLKIEGFQIYSESTDAEDPRIVVGGYEEKILYPMEVFENYNGTEISVVTDITGMDCKLIEGATLNLSDKKTYNSATCTHFDQTLKQIKVQITTPTLLSRSDATIEILKGTFIDSTIKMTSTTKTQAQDGTYIAITQYSFNNPAIISFTNAQGYTILTIKYDSVDIKTVQDHGPVNNPTSITITRTCENVKINVSWKGTITGQQQENNIKWTISSGFKFDELGDLVLRYVILHQDDTKKRFVVTKYGKLKAQGVELSGSFYSEKLGGNLDAIIQDIQNRLAQLEKKT